MQSLNSPCSGQVFSIITRPFSSKIRRLDLVYRLTIGTQRRRGLGKPLLQRLNWSTGQGLFRLQDLQVRPLRRCKWSAQGSLRSTVGFGGNRVHSHVSLVCLWRQTSTVAPVTRFSEATFQRIAPIRIEWRQKELRLRCQNPASNRHHICQSRMLARIPEKTPLRPQNAATKVRHSP